MRDGESVAMPLAAKVPALQPSAGHVIGQVDFGYFHIGVVGSEDAQRRRIEVQMALVVQTHEMAFDWLK